MPRPLLLALLALTAARWMLGGSYELSGDEAYYWQWSQHLDWSYYSKGPGIALAIWSSSFLGDSAWAVRFLSPLLGLASSCFAWNLVNRAFHPRSALWAVILLNATPIINVGSTVFTIDSLMLACWLGAMLAFWRARESGLAGRPAARWWLLCGLALALGFLAKYTTALLILTLLGWLLLRRGERRLWRGSGPWLLFGAALLGLVPVLIWNANNQWITVVHLLERGKIGESTGLHLGHVLQFGLHHFGTYSPLIALGMFASIWPAWRAARRGSPADAFLLACALPILLLYFTLSLKEPGEDNWTAPGMVILGLLLAHHLAELPALAHRPRLKNRLFQAGAITGMAMVLLVLSSDALRAAGVPWPWSKDLAGRLHGHAEATEAIAAIARREFAADERPFFLIANKWQVAASTDHALRLAGDPLPLLRPDRRTPRVHMESSSKIVNQYSFWPRYDARSHPAPGIEASAFLGADALYITDEQRSSAPADLKTEFAETRPAGFLTVSRNGQPLRQYRIFACRGYRGAPL